MATETFPHTPPGDDVRIRELERTLELLREESEVAHVLLGLSGALSEVRSVEQTLEMAVRTVPELLSADRCFAATWDPGRRRFAIQAHFGYDDDRARFLDELAGDEDGLPLLEEVVEGHAPVFVPDVVADGRLGAALARRRGMGAFVGIPLLRRGEQFGALAIEFSDARSFSPKDEALARGVARQVGAALANARQFNLLQALRAFGLRVGSRLRLGAVVDEVAAGAATLLAGDGAAIYLLDQSRSVLVGAANYGVRPPGAERFARIDLRLEPWNDLLHGKTVTVPALGDASSDPEGAVGAVAAPILGSESPVLGAVVVFFGRSLALGADEIEALSVLAAQAAMAIENSQRFERQRRVARSLQQGLLATEMPPMVGCSIGAIYEPASGESDIGGDFYDVFDLGDGVFGIVVGDVSGKGAEAAAHTAQTKYMLRAFAMRNPAPASVMFHLNNALVSGLGEDRFATVVYAVYEPAVRRCQLAVAGHPPPLRYRAEDGSVEVVDPSGGLIGAFEGQEFSAATLALAPGDLLVAYTDGLVDARRGGELYGRERLEAAIARLAPGATPEELTRRIYEDATDFGEVNDDAVVFVLGCNLGD
ncbi:MAG TPA: SpoIIE family protein phosphatase [Actinomycetota bacterium]|nr:SpoIIE family protein phosphatase [Actinomycetota bacterium]